MTRAIALVCAAVVFASACNSAPAPASTAPAVAVASSPLPAVSLPDLSRTEKSVQQQIGESYRSLSSAIDSHGAPRDVAAAYGALGNLLMAAEYFDAAEACYLHAQALAPDEVRWPYYLGHVYMAKADSTKAVAAFDRVLRLRPGDVATLVWLGGVHLDQGEPELAEPLFQQALSQQPGLVAALFGLGTGRCGKPRLRARRRSIRAGAVRGSARVDRSLSARAGVSRTGRHGEGRGASATAGHASKSARRIR